MKTGGHFFFFMGLGSGHPKNLYRDPGRGEMVACDAHVNQRLHSFDQGLFVTESSGNARVWRGLLCIVAGILQDLFVNALL